MKKAFVILIFALMAVFAFSLSAGAVEKSDVVSENSSESFDLISDTDKKNLFDSLSDDAKKTLGELGISDIDPDVLSKISFDKLLSMIVSTTAQQSAVPLKSLGCVMAVILLSSLMCGFKSTLNSGKMQTIIDAVTVLCIVSALVIPVNGTILSAVDVIVTASDFMLAYIPIMLVIMLSSGQAAGGSAYYSMMIMAGQGVAQTASKVISPLLNCFLGISIAGAVSPNVNLSGLSAFIGKIIKWLLGFVMSLFTAVVSFKKILTSSIDNVSTRAVRFTLTSLVPVVGSALSDAYKTIQSSVGLLKSGLGVFVIISVLTVFMPVLVQCFVWIVTMGISKAAAEIMGLSRAGKIIEAVSSVVTTLLAIILCIAAVYVISTALVLIMGGAKG